MEVWEIAALGADLLDGQNGIFLVNKRRLADRTGGRKGQEVDVVTFLKSDGFGVGRSGDFISVRKNKMNAAVGAIGFYGNEIDDEGAASFGLLVGKEFGVVNAAFGAEGRRDDLIALEIAGGMRDADDFFGFATGGGGRSRLGSTSVSGRADFGFWILDFGFSAVGELGEARG